MCLRDQFCRECWLWTWGAVQWLTLVRVPQSCVGKAPWDVLSVRMSVLHKNRKVFMHTESPGCLAPAQWLQTSQCSLLGLGCFSDSGWNVRVVLHLSGQFRPIWKFPHCLAVLNRLQWCHLTDHPNCVSYNFTALGAALQVGYLCLHSDFMFSSTHKVRKAFLFKLGLKFWITTQSLWRHA